MRSRARRPRHPRSAGDVGRTIHAPVAHPRILNASDAAPTTRARCERARDHRLFIVRSDDDRRGAHRAPPGRSDGPWRRRAVQRPPRARTMGACRIPDEERECEGADATDTVPLPVVAELVDLEQRVQIMRRARPARGVLDDRSSAANRGAAPAARTLGRSRSLRSTSRALLLLVPSPMASARSVLTIVLRRSPSRCMFAADAPRSPAVSGGRRAGMATQRRDGFAQSTSERRLPTNRVQTVAGRSPDERGTAASRAAIDRGRQLADDPRPSARSGFRTTVSWRPAPARGRG